MMDEDDFDDDFEAAFFTETILGELGSSSGSHKQAPAIDDDDDALEDDKTFISADSGASDRETPWQHVPAPESAPQVIETPSEDPSEEPTTNQPEETKEQPESRPEEEEEEKYPGLPDESKSSSDGGEMNPLS
jgi:hypothetical protein